MKKRKIKLMDMINFLKFFKSLFIHANIGHYRIETSKDTKIPDIVETSTKKEEISEVEKLVQHVTKNNLKFTFQIGKDVRIVKGSQLQYVILTENEAKAASQQTQNYVTEFKLNIHDINSIYTFAVITHFGDNVYYIFTDSSGKIYRYNADNGWNPWIDEVCDNLKELIGEYSLEDLQDDYHFKFSSPIVRFSDIFDTNRIVFIEPEGFFIDKYPELLIQLFRVNNTNITLNKFEYETVDGNNSIEKYTVTVSFNNYDGIIEIEKTKWFDISFPKQINNILSNIPDFQMNLYMVKEEDKDIEDFGLTFLMTKEMNLFKKSRLIYDPTH
jgi:hypothetical protein